MLDPRARAAALLRFLLDREPAQQELTQFQRPGFDCDVFLVALLCSDEATDRYGDMAQFLIEQLKTEAARDALPHKLAHDLALAKEDLAALQGKLDRFSGQLIELLKQEDRIVGLFETARGLQAEFNALCIRLDDAQERLLQVAEAENAD